MTRKRATVFICVFVALALIMVLASAVFVVRDVTVTFASTTNYLTSSKSDIVRAAQIDKNQSIFFVNKKAAKNRIEAAFPYARVLEVETRIPNHIVLHVGERKPFGYIQKGNRYYIVDKKFKVLDIQEDIKPDLIEVSGFKDFSVAQAGMFLQDTLFENSVLYFESFEFSEQAMLQYITAIRYNKENDRLEVTISPSTEGSFYLRFEKASSKLKQKIQMACSVYIKNEVAKFPPEGVFVAFEADGQIQYTGPQRPAD